MIVEGKMNFKGFNTYYRIVGSEKKNTPLILLHGGPGSTHNYFECLDKVSILSNRPLIMYDMLGCGNSYIEGHAELFNMNTWEDELYSLVKHLKLQSYYLLGQSFGGMLLFDYILKHKEENIKGIILSSTLPSSALWASEGMRMIEELPKDERDAIDKVMVSNDYNDPTYLKAVSHYMELHCSKSLDSYDFECVKRKKKTGTLSYITAWGPNEFMPLGNLKDFNVIDRLHEITLPTLIFSGGRDLSTPYINKLMNDSIKNSKWYLFQSARHMCFVEENDMYIKELCKFLLENEN